MSPSLDQSLPKGTTLSFTPPTDPTLAIYVALRTTLVTTRSWVRDAAVERFGDERGEGVISAAIAVLVMALLGVAMYTLFSGTLTHANSNVDKTVDHIGN